MKESAFTQNNVASWQKIEQYNKKIINRDVSKLTKEEIVEFAELYRALGLQLAYARTHFANTKLLTYLNQLMGVTHNAFYVREKASFKDFANYFTQTFPNAVRQYKGYITVSFLLFMAGLITCFVLALIDTQYLYFFMPKEQLELIDFSTTSREVDLAMFSAMIMTNNIRVSLLAFAWGILGGIGTVYVMFTNGASIGALTSFVVTSGASLTNYLALLLPHGVIELMAIFISGAAGLVLGKSVLIPNELKRTHSIIKGAKEAAKLMGGVVTMLVFAGLIEGFFTPIDVSPYAKLAFAFATFVFLVWYFVVPRKTLS